MNILKRTHIARWWPVLLLLVMPIVFLACSGASDDMQTVYTCPMHPEVISDEPGVCAKCNMDLGPMDKTMPKTQADALMIYSCPMHPEVVSNELGDCPKCNMALTLPDGDGPENSPHGTIDEHAGHSAKTEGIASMEAGFYYTCGMHPELVLTEPGLCPICKMELIKRSVDDATMVQLTPETVQKIGVRTAEVQRQPLIRTLRSVGHVAYDETRVHNVTTKVSGWIEKLHVEFVGQTVTKGQPLLEIYSPELVATQEEYLLAMQNRDEMAGSQFPEIARSAKSLLNSTRERLRLWDITDEQVAELERTQQVQRTMTLYAPATGIAIHKVAFEGDRIGSMDHLYRIADISNLWVNVQVYEYELPWIKIGQQASITLQARPGQTYRGRVSYIFPTVDRDTRTVRLLIEVANPRRELLPDMYAEVQIESRLSEEAVVVPAEALLRTGTREVVIVNLGEGMFEPREIKTGVETAEGFEVRSGLEAGDSIVTSAQFLIDSESRLKETITKMLKQSTGGAATFPAGHQH
jgi:RND family efflux transporter MFP subunit